MVAVAKRVGPMAQFGRAVGRRRDARDVGEHQVPRPLHQARHRRGVVGREQLSLALAVCDQVLRTVRKRQRGDALRW
eukprot:7379616-Prymnesium_polylepis.3